MIANRTTAAQLTLFHLSIQYLTILFVLVAIDALVF